MTGGRRARIYAVVRRIPRGRVATYGQVAEWAGLRGQARLVGYALAALDVDTDVPWHRVVNARGTISLPARDHSALMQRARLEAEGVRFRAGRIALDERRWGGPRAVPRRVEGSWPVRMVEPQRVPPEPDAGVTAGP